MLRSISGMILSLYLTPYWSTSVDKPKWFPPRKIYWCHKYSHYIMWLRKSKSTTYLPLLNVCRFQESFLIPSIETKCLTCCLSSGIPSQIVKGIKGLYIDAVAQVVTKDGNTNFFQIVAGVLQGDTLALILIHHCLRLCHENCNGQRW